MTYGKPKMNKTRTTSKQSNQTHRTPNDAQMNELRELWDEYTRIYDALGSTNNNDAHFILSQDLTKAQRRLFDRQKQIFNY